jgi:hypothetical protein
MGIAHGVVGALHFRPQGRHLVEIGVVEVGALRLFIIAFMGLVLHLHKYGPAGGSEGTDHQHSPGCGPVGIKLAEPGKDRAGHGATRTLGLEPEIGDGEFRLAGADTAFIGIVAVAVDAQIVVAIGKGEVRERGFAQLFTVDVDLGPAG